jgi:TRAP-type C4-dicarboxylate transport system substrate-binding protein
VQRKRFRDDSREVKAACLKTGISIRYLSPEDRRTMRAACTPIYERLQAEFGDLMQKLVEAGQ